MKLEFPHNPRETQDLGIHFIELIQTSSAKEVEKVKFLFYCCVVGGIWNVLSGNRVTFVVWCFHVFISKDHQDWKTRPIPNPLGSIL